MSVRPIDLFTVQQMNEVSQIKYNETTRPVVEQVNIMVQNEKKVEHNAEQVVQKSDIDNKGRKFDAKDKSDNEYHRRKKENKDGTVHIKGQSDKSFDMKA